MSDKNNQPTEKNSGEGLGFTPTLPQVSNQGRSNAAAKGFTLLLLFGGILFLGFLGYRSAVKSNNAETENKAAIAASKEPEPPNLELPETPVEPLPDAMASEVVPLPGQEPDPDISQPPPPAPPAEGERQPTPHEIRLRSPLMVSSNGNNNGIGNNGLGGSGAAPDGAAPETGGVVQLGADGAPPQESGGGAVGATPAFAPQSGVGSGISGALGGGSSGGGLGGSLKGTYTPPNSAGRFGNRNMLLAKGTVITCNMATRLETQIAGQLACVIPNDIYSENGRVVLLERGTVVEGEYQRVANLGRNRIFVLWTRARTPKGVIINLDSTASDRLGGAGMDGYVNNHWFKRFGNALLFSMIQDGISTGFSRLDKKGDKAQTVIYENSEESTQKIVEEIIKSTSNIPPTIYRNHGDKVGIYITRDLDFSTVYRLKGRLPDY